MQITNPCKKCIVRAGCSIPHNCHLQDKYRKFIKLLIKSGLVSMSATIVYHTLIICRIWPYKNNIMVTALIVVLSCFIFVYSIILESKADKFISKLRRRK